MVRISIEGTAAVGGDVFETSAVGEVCQVCLDTQAAGPTPADSGIAATEGDDTSPPNSIKDGKLNSIAVSAVANLGFSASEYF